MCWRMWSNFKWKLWPLEGRRGWTLEKLLTSHYPMMTVRKYFFLPSSYYSTSLLPAVKIGFSSDVYDVSESTPFLNVQVVKNGSNDIAVSVLLYTTAGTALGKHIQPYR